MAFEEDLSLFLDTDGFAVAVNVTTPNGEVLQVPVIFDKPHADAFGVMESSEPSALGRSVDLAHVPHRSQVLFNDEAWLVVGHQPDGTGLTRLLLEPAT